MALPATALALPLAAIIARVLKTSINEAMTQDYILMARVKGFSRARIVGREALRNALVPTLTLAGVQFTFLVGGTVLVEKIFSYPGIGNMAIRRGHQPRPAADPGPDPDPSRCCSSPSIYWST